MVSLSLYQPASSPSPSIMRSSKDIIRLPPPLPLQQSLPRAVSQPRTLREMMPGPPPPKKNFQSPKFFSPLEEEIRQKEADETQYRDVLDRHALGTLRSDSVRNRSHAGLLVGRRDRLALADALLLDLGLRRLGDGRGDVGVVADVARGLGGCGATAGGPVLVGRGVVGWRRGLLGLCRVSM